VEEDFGGFGVGDAGGEESTRKEEEASEEEERPEEAGDFGRLLCSLTSTFSRFLPLSYKALLENVALFGMFHTPVSTNPLGY